MTLHNFIILSFTSVSITWAVSEESKNFGTSTIRDYKKVTKDKIIIHIKYVCIYTVLVRINVNHKLRE